MNVQYDPAFAKMVPLAATAWVATTAFASTAGLALIAVKTSTTVPGRPASMGLHATTGSDLFTANVPLERPVGFLFFLFARNRITKQYLLLAVDSWLHYAK